MNIESKYEGSLALKYSHVSIGNIMKEEITVIKSTTNKSYCDTFSTERDIYR